MNPSAVMAAASGIANSTPHSGTLNATPINLGTSELISINDLVSLVESIGGIKLQRHYDLGAPRGVAGRNSDNTLIKKLMNWAPSIRLEDGMEKTYKWIYDEMTSGKASVVNALPKQAVAAQ